MGVLLVLPVTAYTIYGNIAGFLKGQLALRFFPKMWLDPAFYFSWQNLMSTGTGFAVWVGGIVGVFIADRKRERPLLLGLWIGYILYGFTFPYHFTTHDYYHMPVIPIAILSLSPLLKAGLDRFMERSPGVFPRLILVVLVLFGITAARPHFGKILVIHSVIPLWWLG
jgi:hypothetical protein